MSDDIKVDDQVKKAEADMMVAKKDDSVVSFDHLAHVTEHMKWIIEEKKRLGEMLEEATQRELKKKEIFKEYGLDWDDEISLMLDVDSMFVMDNDLTSYEKKVSKLADWIKRTTTKLGDLI